jgi:hypothetical protein
VPDYADTAVVKVRIDAGTDIAMVGAWDAQRDDTPWSDAELRHALKLQDSDAAQGFVFIVRLGGDGGGPIDVYVDEVIPPDVGRGLRQVADARRLDLPTGTLRVSGLEEYRRPAATAKTGNADVTVPPGSYAIRCYAARDVERAAPSEAALENLVGRDDVQFYDRVNRRGCLAGPLLLLLVFPALSLWIDWRIALGVAVVAAFGFYPLFQWLAMKNSRYRRLSEIVPTHRLRNEEPWLVLELRSTRDSMGLKVGSVSL